MSMVLVQVVDAQADGAYRGEWINPKYVISVEGQGDVSTLVLDRQYTSGQPNTHLLIAEAAEKLVARIDAAREEKA